ncbi:hypothetical protein G1H11_06135 [Phytoactinopolyspora alkaliphila]|uniref:Heparinase n=1 Tax=Phytoactinopolyspora alkaliphila TaxID=1783498 RepID=A0A6N9YJ13_9ACTN|nr:heparinase II/III family protein [Phytoactinopolyspora alkaliphila]NED94888.1 hypothetical protein [Phytoactinopolyspora alkaliphila]
MRRLRGQAESELGTAWPQPRASQYTRFFRDGSRTAWEEQVFARQERLSRAVVLAAATGDDVWVDEAADGLVLLCEQTSWCWAAHEGSCSAGGNVLPDIDTPYLDLGAGDVAAQLAWADHTLGAGLNTRYPGLRERIRLEVSRRVIQPFLRRTDWHWLGLDGDVHNWCPWICGNVLVAALRLAEDDDERVRAVAWAVQGLDRYLGALPADGSIDEGYEYWWNGACRALEALDVLAHATGGVLDAADVPVVRQTVAFPHRMHIGGHWYVNVADASAKPHADQPWHVPYRWARRVGDRSAAAHAVSYRDPGEPASKSRELGRLLSALHDPDWVAAVPSPPPLIGSVWLSGTQLGLAREDAGSRRGLTLAVKGGHNAEHHNHNDVGCVMIAVDGVPAVVDAGRPTYTAQTFSRDRYAIWTMQSSWHNVPEVLGMPQSPGAEFRAREVSVADEDARFRVRLELSAAYAVPQLEHWWRNATLDREAQRVIIEDTWAYSGASVTGSSTMHYLLAGEIEVPAPGRVVVRPLDHARPLVLTWDPGRATGTTETRVLDDPMLVRVWGAHVTRLALHAPAGSHGVVTLTAEVHA